MNDYFSRLGRKGGQKGGRTTAARLSSTERSESARHAAQARWRQNPRSKVVSSWKIIESWPPSHLASAVTGADTTLTLDRWEKSRPIGEFHIVIQPSQLHREAMGCCHAEVVRCREIIDTADRSRVYLMVAGRGTLHTNAAPHPCGARVDLCEVGQFSE